MDAVADVDRRRVNVHVVPHIDQNPEETGKLVHKRYSLSYKYKDIIVIFVDTE